MEFIIRIIANYEDAYVPKLTERFPELAEGTTIEDNKIENSKPMAVANTLKLSDK